MKRGTIVWSSGDTKVLSGDAFMATSFFERLTGLFDRRISRHREWGLWISPCSSIHTFALGFAIDVVFLNDRGVVATVYENVRPNKIRGCLGAKSAIELPAGTVRQVSLDVGSILTWRGSA